MSRLAMRAATTMLLLVGLCACRSTAPPTSTPVDRVATTAPPAVRGRHEVEFDLVSGLVVVPVRMPGIDRVLWFMLDTGAPTIVPPALADELGLRRDGPLVGSDAADHTWEAAQVELPELQVGELRMHDIAAVVSTFPVPSWLCHPLDGILGVGLDPGTGFADRVAVEIDYQRKQLVLVEPGALRTQGGSTAPLRRTRDDENGEPIPVTSSSVLVTVEGQRGWVSLDTGNNGGTRVGKALFERLGRSVDEPGLVTRRGVLGHTVAGRQIGVRHEGRLRSLELGALAFADVPVLIDPRAGAGFETMLLGYEFLRHFRVIVDHPSEEVRLIPVPGSDPRVLEPELGVMWDEIDGVVEVVSMLTDGPADRAGILLGDRLRAVDGIPMVAGDRTGECAIVRRLTEGDRDAPVSLEIGRGDRVLSFELRRSAALP